jgi:predicted nucleic acid-binding protein
MSNLSHLTLIDTSVWVDVLRDGSDEFTPLVEQLLHDHLAAMCEPVWLELYRGVRGKRELRRLDELKQLCRWLTFDGRCWNLAADVAFNCRKKGHNIPLGDVLIFACAKNYETPILQSDKHFNIMAKHG